MGINKEVKVELSAEEVGEILVNADDQFQAKVLNWIAQHIDAFPLERQLLSISQNKELTMAGRLLMERIGEYAK